MKKEIRDLLRLRAIAMAEEPEQNNDVSITVQLITFTLGGENYGIESDYVREVFPLKDFTPLPGVASYILGVVNVRGQILPVVDLKKFFNLPEKGIGELNKIIILQNDQMEFGILTDIVQGTQTIDIKEIKNIPSSISGIGEAYLKGVTKESLIVLNAGKLLTDKSMIVNHEQM
jgi:purine-binding chemotaxis protein CheW